MYSPVAATMMRDRPDQLPLTTHHSPATTHHSPLTNDHSPTTIEVVSPSRLHFGLLSFGGQGRQFGGAGAMVSRPGMTLRVSGAKALEARGPHAGRVLEFVRRWARFESLAEPPACRIEVAGAPPQHVGLGTGTQFGLSVAAALNAFFERPQSSPAELAASVRRGRRSAVGTYGFVHGGLIVERGKTAGEALAPLDFHGDIPSAWRFLLVRPAGDAGLSGDDECRVFAQLPPVPPDVTEQLTEELRRHLLPAMLQQSFTKFSAGLHRFGRLAGNCFAQRQGGPFNGPLLTRLVELLRRLGLEGAGQSSWGPTVFALAPNQQAAEDVAARLEREAGVPLSVIITPPDNHGAEVRVLATERVGA
jgi:beta-ribofuranosylaminobenzene 5'-phosphate synthase